MALRLPPLSSLRFFEAAGRHQSFRLAASELNVTPSAVSHGIVALERALGIELFVRKPGKLSLTPEGADYLPYVAEALSLIAIGTERIPSTLTNRTIRVSCAPTIASRWLLPRLHKYNARWPNISVTVDTSHRQVGFPVDGFDFAIRRSRATVAGAAWTRLYGERLVPVCSPSYRDRICDRDGNLELGRATLIHLTSVSEDWQAWLERTETAGVAPAKGLRFDIIQLAIEAAAMGLGVAIGRRPLIDPELASGTLVELGLATIAADGAYWLVSSEGAGHRPDLLGFRRWLLEEAAAFEDGLAADRPGQAMAPQRGR